MALLPESRLTVNSRWVRRTLLAVLLLVVPTACFSAFGRARDPFKAPWGEGEGNGEIRVRVENQNFLDAVVHATRGGERRRLGDVTGKSERTFRMGWDFSLPLEFDIELIGGRGCLVRPLSVDPGDNVWVRIPTQVSVSSCYAGKES